MFSFLKKKDSEKIAQGLSSPSESTPPESAFFSRLKQGLSKTRQTFSKGLAHLFLGKKELTPLVIEEIEHILFTADVGIETTEYLIQSLTSKLARNELSDTEAALTCLKADMKALLRPCEIPLAIPEDHIGPFITLMIGINGAGKTTTIGKLAHYFKQQNKTCLLAAGDTFRAAAIEQLQAWGERNHLPVIAQQAGADTAAVIFDAANAAKTRQIDILLADTAGRLHTQTHLMAELQKIKRVLTKVDPTAPHEVLLVLDATLGQNALAQVKQFNEALGVTGVILTKLDGTAKGGILFAIAKQTGIPIRFIGVGEGIDDLRPFEADAFVEALFET